MSLVVRRALLVAIAVVVLALLVAVGFAWSGIYEVGADVAHTRPVHALLETMRERSVAARASAVQVPGDLADPARIRQGAGNYDAMCSGCHLAPGMEPTELSRGLYPPPPDLRAVTVDPAAAFWVIKHGLKATAMPAWGRSMEDRYIWNLVAFLQQLPELDADRYRMLVASSEGHSHGGGESKAHAHEAAASTPGMPATNASAPHAHPPGTPAHEDEAAPAMEPDATQHEGHAPAQQAPAQHQHAAPSQQAPAMHQAPTGYQQHAAPAPQAPTQHQQHATPAQQAPAQHPQHAGAAHDAMPMHGMLGPYGMGRESSGTSWQPDATPMSGHHFTRGAWQAMTHGFVNAVHADADGPRGGSDSFVESMFMLMAQRETARGRLGLRAMVSLDPWLVGKDGYRLPLQTGETADGTTPLIDRQHPHDLFMELSASYAWLFGDDAAAFVYAGLPGEPALGPPTFMHRFSGIDNPEAPLGHHWLDATHISFGVITVGWIWRGFKLEGSLFNGREPDEKRHDIELHALDSWSARVSWNPTPRWALQWSHGELEQPEQLEPEVDIKRTTASVMHHRKLGAGQWQATLAWGRNQGRAGQERAGAGGHDNATEAWLLESAYAWSGRWTVHGRVERVEKDELFREGEPLHGQAFNVAKATVGVVRDFPAGRFGRMGVGAQVSHHRLPAALESSYGGDPDSALVFVRWKF